MNARLFRLFETRQRIDRALRDEQRRRRPDPLRIVELRSLRLRAGRLMRRLMRRHAFA